MFDVPAPRKRPTSASAVAGFVMSLVFLAPLGLAFSIVGLFQTRDGEYGGRVFAILGAILGVLGTVPMLVWFFFLRG